jgi:hypothetical protein
MSTVTNVSPKPPLVSIAFIAEPEKSDDENASSASSLAQEPGKNDKNTSITNENAGENDIIPIENARKNEIPMNPSMRERIQFCVETVQTKMGLASFSSFCRWANLDRVNLDYTLYGSRKGNKRVFAKSIHKDIAKKINSLFKQHLLPDQLSQLNALFPVTNVSLKPPLVSNNDIPSYALFNNDENTSIINENAEKNGSGNKKVWLTPAMRENIRFGVETIQAKMDLDFKDFCTKIGLDSDKWLHLRGIICGQKKGDEKKFTTTTRENVLEKIKSVFKQYLSPDQLSQLTALFPVALFPVTNDDNALLVSTVEPEKNTSIINVFPNLSFVSNSGIPFNALPNNDDSAFFNNDDSAFFNNDDSAFFNNDDSAFFNNDDSALLASTVEPEKNTSIINVFPNLSFVSNGGIPSNALPNNDDNALLASTVEPEENDKNTSIINENAGKRRIGSKKIQVTSAMRENIRFGVETIQAKMGLRSFASFCNKTGLNGGHLHHILYGKKKGNEKIFPINIHQNTLEPIKSVFKQHLSSNQLSQLTALFPVALVPVPVTNVFPNLSFVSNDVIPSYALFNNDDNALLVSALEPEKNDENTSIVDENAGKKRIGSKKVQVTPAMRENMRFGVEAIQAKMGLTSLNSFRKKTGLSISLLQRILYEKKEGNYEKKEGNKKTYLINIRRNTLETIKSVFKLYLSPDQLSQLTVLFPVTNVFPNLSFVSNDGIPSNTLLKDDDGDLLARVLKEPEKGDDGIPSNTLLKDDDGDLLARVLKEPEKGDDGIPSNTLWPNDDDGDLLGSALIAHHGDDYFSMFEKAIDNCGSGPKRKWV